MQLKHAQKSHVTSALQFDQHAEHVHLQQAAILYEPNLMRASANKNLRELVLIVRWAIDPRKKKKAHLEMYEVAIVCYVILRGHREIE